MVVTISLINCDVIKYGGELNFKKTKPGDIKIYNGNSGNVLLASGSNNNFYKIDKENFDIIKSKQINEIKMKNMTNERRTAFYDELYENTYIAISEDGKDGTNLYKLDENLKVEASIEIENENVLKNQFFDLNFDESNDIITFIGSKGIHRFSALKIGSTQKDSLYASYKFSDRYDNFEVSSISYNDRILYIAGKSGVKPVVMKFYLGSTNTDRIKLLENRSVRLNSNVQSITNLLKYKKSISIVDEVKGSYPKMRDQLSVFGFDNQFKIGVSLFKSKSSASDGKNIGIFIKDGINDPNFKHDAIYAMKIKEENGIYSVETSSISYYKKQVEITGVYYIGGNRFVITTNDTYIQSFEIDQTKPSKNEIIYPPQPHLPHKHNKWWRVLFGVLIAGICLILSCGIVSLYIVIKKKDVFTQFMRSNGFIKEKEEKQINNNDSSKFATTTIFFDKYQKLDKDPEEKNENNLNNEKIDIDNNASYVTDDGSSSSNNINNQNNNNNNNNNNESQNYDL